MGRKRQQQVTGKTFEERAKLAEESREWWITKQVKKLRNRKGKKANNSRSGQQESWKW
jgi:hypothetical protein